MVVSSCRCQCETRLTVTDVCLTRQPDIPARQTTQIAAWLKSSARCWSLFVMPAASGAHIKPDTGKIIEMLISRDAIIDRFSLGISYVPRDVFARFEGRYRSLHAAGSTVVAGLNYRKLTLSFSVFVFAGLHHLPVHRMRSD